MEQKKYLWEQNNTIKLLRLLEKQRGTEKEQLLLLYTETGICVSDLTKIFQFNWNIFRTNLNQFSGDHEPLELQVK